MQQRTLKPTIAAESNPEGAPAGGISALMYDIVQPLTSNILQKRNDTWVISYKAYLQKNFIFQENFIFSRAQSVGNDPRVVPPQSSTNFLPFLSGSGESASAQIPLDGIWLGAAGIRSTEYGYIRICINKKQEIKSPCLKFLKVLRKLLSRSFLSRVRDRVPRSFFPFPTAALSDRSQAAFRLTCGLRRRKARRAQ